MSTPAKICTHAKLNTVGLMFSSPSSLLSTTQIAKLINIINMPNPSLERKCDSFKINTLRKFNTF